MRKWQGEDSIPTLLLLPPQLLLRAKAQSQKPQENKISPAREQGGSTATVTPVGTRGRLLFAPSPGGLGEGRAPLPTRRLGKMQLKGSFGNPSGGTARTCPPFPTPASLERGVRNRHTRARAGLLHPWRVGHFPPRLRPALGEKLGTTALGPPLPPAPAARLLASGRAPARQPRL